MTQHHNQLTPAELERLAILGEECAEAIQMVGKIMRHGYESYNPFITGPHNRAELENELGHVLFAIQQMVKADDICQTHLNKHKKDKGQKIGQWLHHQSDTQGQ